MKLSSILRWPYWTFRQPWQDHVSQFEYLDWDTQRRLAYKQIDKGGFGYWTVFVAGIGFLTDAYDIFAVNTVLPMLEVVYWGGNMRRHEEVLIGLSLLVGTFFGQLLFGVLADRYGRKRMYGLELAVLTGATILMTVSSKGALNETNRLAWISTWRFIMGIGIGGDYPLSAVLTAEFAPRRHRHRMLATVFFMQPVGSLLADVVSVAAVAIARSKISADARPENCIGECAAAVDATWRWIVGIGAIPAGLAIFVRWWIPESPRYTLEVEKDPHRAQQDVQLYYASASSVFRRSFASHRSIHTRDPDPRARARDVEDEADIQPQASTSASPDRGPQRTLVFGEPQEMKETRSSAHTASRPSASSPDSSARRLARKETWREFWVGLWAFLYTDGNWTDLAGTSLSWMTLDFAFYFLSVNNPKILDKLWKSTGTEHPLDTMLMENGYRAMIAVSTGAVVGGAVFIAMARYRWHLQLYGFWILAATFVVVGASFVVLLRTRYFAAVIVLYAISSLFFDLGPNTSTFMIAAEVFPTKYRCSCHGISAAAGKFGSIIAQVFLAYAKFQGKGVNDAQSNWLGWVLIIFTVWSVFGAIVTKYWVPNPVDIWGRNRSLEDLGLGKVHRKRLEREERETWQVFVSGD